MGGPLSVTFIDLYMVKLKEKAIWFSFDLRFTKKKTDFRTMDLRVRIRGLEMLVFRKILRPYLMNGPLPSLCQV